MNSPEQREIAEQLASHEQWEWCPGMAWTDGMYKGRVNDLDDVPEGALPDLEDFATSAILLRVATVWGFEWGSMDSMILDLGVEAGKYILRLWGAQS